MTPEQLADRLSKAAQELDKPEKLLASVGRVVRPQIVREAPKRTGELARRVFVRTVPSSKRLSMGSSASYAVYVHARNAFITRGVAKARGEIEQAMGEEGNDIWKRVAGG